MKIQKFLIGFFAVLLVGTVGLSAAYFVRTNNVASAAVVPTKTVQEICFDRFSENKLFADFVIDETVSIVVRSGDGVGVSFPASNGKRFVYVSCDTYRDELFDFKVNPEDFLLQMLVAQKNVVPVKKIK